ncbi:MAG TPA: c-type cytochrome [Terriglobales bacterium]|nr:c-type cytochrome [Terriglobales bacterium]
MIRKSGSIAFFCLVILAQDRVEPGKQPPTMPEDLVAGERIFRTQCAYCHGQRGEGGRGATLARPRLVHAADDRAMFEVIEKGIPDTEMPGQWYTPREIWQVVAFVRTLGRVARQTIEGDPGRGEEYYAGKGGCPQCHTVNGRGGALGPDLTDIGARRSVSYLRESLLEPEAAVPDGFMQVQLVTRDGRHVTGVRLREDTFSIQIRDLSDQFWSFFRSELVQVNKQPGKSPMPSYRGVFTPGEVEDLIAYLNSLGREQ